MSERDQDVREPVPETIGHYQVVCALGRGGLAWVYLARPEPPEPRLFAIKVLDEALDVVAQDALLESIRTASRAHHPHVAAIHEVGVEGTVRFFVMDYVEGEPLSLLLDQLRERSVRLPDALAAYVVAAACEGLHAFHELKGSQGEPLPLVHGAVTPNNLLLGYDGIPRIVGFGEAKALAGAYVPDDRQVDVYGLGTVLWQAATGRAFPYCDSLPSPSSIRTDYPKELEAITTSALEDGYATARDLGRALRQYLVSTQRAVAAPELEQFMKENFAERYERRCELRRWVFEDGGATDEVSMPKVTSAKQDLRFDSDLFTPQPRGHTGSTPLQSMEFDQLKRKGEIPEGVPLLSPEYASPTKPDARKDTPILTPPPPPAPQEPMEASVTVAAPKKKRRLRLILLLLLLLVGSGAVFHFLNRDPIVEEDPAKEVPEDDLGMGTDPVRVLPVDPPRRKKRKRTRR